MKHLVLLSALLLMACIKPETPAQAVYQAQSNYNIAATVALKYIQLPRCSSVKLTPCSKPDVVLKVKHADTVAYNSIKAAQNAVRTPGFAESKVTTITASATYAVDAFVKITDELEIR